MTVAPKHLRGISFPQKYHILIHALGYLGDIIYRVSVRGIFYMQVCFSGASPGHLFPKEYAPGHFRGISKTSISGHHLHAGLLLLKGSTPFGAYINNKGWYGVRDLRARGAPRRTNLPALYSKFFPNGVGLVSHTRSPTRHAHPGVKKLLHQPAFASFGTTPPETSLLRYPHHSFQGNGVFSLRN